MSYKHSAGLFNGLAVCGSWQYSKTPAPYTTGRALNLIGSGPLPVSGD